MEIFITFTRRPWYSKKRFAIPVCVLTILAIAGIILGAVLGARAAINFNTARKVFDALFNSMAGDSFISKKLVIASSHELKDKEIRSPKHMISVFSFLHLRKIFFPNLFLFISKYYSSVDFNAGPERSIN
jgi:ABC-type lipoprotein release transport system permease subunit